MGSPPLDQINLNPFELFRIITKHHFSFGTAHASRPIPAHAPKPHSPSASPALHYRDPVSPLTRCGRRAPAPPRAQSDRPPCPIDRASDTPPSSSVGFKRGHTTAAIAFSLPCSPLRQLMRKSPPTAPFDFLSTVGNQSFTDLDRF
jgi:hypothetical protein